MSTVKGPSISLILTVAHIVQYIVVSWEPFVRPRHILFAYMDPVVASFGKCKFSFRAARKPQKLRSRIKGTPPVKIYSQAQVLHH